MQAALRKKEKKTIPRVGGGRGENLSYTLKDVYFLTQHFTQKIVLENVLAKLPSLSTYVTHSTAVKEKNNMITGAFSKIENSEGLNKWN